MNSVDFAPLFKRVGFSISDAKLLTEAFTHRSAVNENSSLPSHNERLEFLGDAVLELVTTEYLFRMFESPEGELTNLRSALVKGDHLAQVARKLCMGEYLMLSKGEERSGGADKDYLLANLVEAFIGAIYLDQGIEKVRSFIAEFVLCDLNTIIAKREHIDAKSEFQEITQGELGVTPHYEVVLESGLDHEKTFVIAAYIGDLKAGEGQGGSKKEAQITAAADALAHKEKWMKQS
ncbi:ribonuclease III [Candidatus Gracilibacteria bacterium]|nr:ribonuclease III [Candidatus Gracilibacteria bacterium]